MTTGAPRRLELPDDWSCHMTMPDAEITCVDCGGTCYPLGWFPDDGPLDPGTVLPYRCKDCLDRWDIVIGEEGDSDNY